MSTQNEGVDSYVELTNSIEQVAYHMKNIALIMNEPDKLSFDRCHLLFGKLVGALNKGPLAMASLAYMAQRDDGGRVVNSSKPKDFFVKQYGMSYLEVKKLFDLAEQLFVDPREKIGPSGEDESGQSHEDSLFEDPSDLDKSEEERQAEAERRRKEEEKRRRAEARKRKEEEKKAEKARQEQERIRQEMAEEDQRRIREELLQGINKALDDLSPDAAVPRSELFNRARAKANDPNTTSDQVLAWLKEEISHLNDEVRKQQGKPQDVDTAVRDRYFYMSKPDADGGVYFSGRTDAATAAMLIQAMNIARRPGAHGLDPKEDNRTYKQRFADQFAEILSVYLHSKHTRSAQGLTSIVVTATLKELENLQPGDKLPTSTGIPLGIKDIIRLGAGITDYLHIVDDDKWESLAVGRAKRSATLLQKIALIASELCCSHPGCDVPANQCDAHHLYAWSYGGATDINNLTLLCRAHHSDNNDRRNFYNNMGHAQRDPRSGRVGFARPGSLVVEYNESDAARKSSVSKLRRTRGSTDGVGVSGAPDTYSDPGGPPF